MYSEARAKRIIELEKEAALLKWDKKNPEPPTPTLRQMVVAALSDPCWIKSAPAFAGKDSYRHEWHSLERSGKVAQLNAPITKYKHRRQVFEAQLAQQNRQRLISMLREK